MSTVTLNINGRPFEIACGEDQQSHLRQLAAAISKRMHDQERLFSGPRSDALPDPYLWLLTALSMQEEIRNLHDDMIALRRQYDAEIESIRRDSDYHSENAMNQLYDSLANRLERLAHNV